MDAIAPKDVTARATPVRGSLRLHATASSPRVTAGTDFSIFVIIQNPFDVPITIYQVQTHIPVELLDVNGMKLAHARWEEEQANEHRWGPRLYNTVRHWMFRNNDHSGIAIAVGTNFDPQAGREFAKVQAHIENIGDNSSFIGLQFAFPQNPSSEELDRIFRRLDDYRKGLIPATLQPGNSVVNQFVLRTRRWLLFTPLTHTFQIQVDYSSDGVDHADTVAYNQEIRSTMGAMVAGAMIGAVIGSTLKGLADPAAPTAGVAMLTTITTALLASIAVVVAFARKSTAQPIISIEDFWGGALIGFSTGFFGFEQFTNLFATGGSS
jgi:hypothetical protein